MRWRNVLDGVDAVESWIVGQAYWVQVPLLLAVLVPASWFFAGVVDRIVERILWPYTRREIRAAAVAAIAHRRVPDGAQSASVTGVPTPAVPVGTEPTRPAR